MAGGGQNAIVAGAPFREIDGETQRGAVYVFGAAGATAAPVCSVANLRLSSVRVLGAAGQRGWDLALRDTGAGACSLRGYPAVRLLDRHDRPTIAARHARGFPSRP